MILVHKWVKAFQNYNRQDTGHHDVISTTGVKQLEAENDQPKKLLGEKDLEITILRDVLKKKTMNESRHVPGYSYGQQGKKIPDEQVQE